MASIHISLSENARSYIDRKMATGAYASEEAVINEGLEMLGETDRDHSLEDLSTPGSDPEYQRWLVEVVEQRFDEIKAGRMRLVPGGDVLSRLEARRLLGHPEQE